MYGLVIGNHVNQRKWWMLNGGANILIAATHALSQAAYSMLSPEFNYAPK